MSLWSIVAAGLRALVAALRRVRASASGELVLRTRWLSERGEPFERRSSSLDGDAVIRGTLEREGTTPSPASITVRDVRFGLVAELPEFALERLGQPVAGDPRGVVLLDG